jgi:hypothetical protein
MKKNQILFVFLLIHYILDIIEKLYIYSILNIILYNLNFLKFKSNSQKLKIKKILNKYITNISKL